MEEWERIYREKLKDDQALRKEWDLFELLPQEVNPNGPRIQAVTGRGGAVELLVAFARALREYHNLEDGK